MENNREKELELINNIKELTNHEISLEDLCEELGIDSFEALGLIQEIKQSGINISAIDKDKGIYIINFGDQDFSMSSNYDFEVNEDNNRFLVISDTRLGSNRQQISILNDLYKKANALGYKNVIHCGNISEGLYNNSSPYYDSLLIKDTLKQVDYIVDRYPYIEGMHTYFITGPKDLTHLTKKAIDIGKKIAESREDFTYLGKEKCLMQLKKVKMLVQNLKLAKTYTVSYRAQQVVDAIRSEDRCDILLYGGLLQQEKFTHRNIKILSVPSLVASTDEMQMKRYSNTIGGYFLDIQTDDKGYLKNVDCMDTLYYNTDKQDYQKAKTLRLTSQDLES